MNCSTPRCAPCLPGSSSPRTVVAAGLQHLEPAVAQGTTARAVPAAVGIATRRNRRLQLLASHPLCCPPAVPSSPTQRRLVQRNGQQQAQRGVCTAGSRRGGGRAGEKAGAAGVMRQAVFTSERRATHNAAARPHPGQHPPKVKATKYQEHSEDWPVAARCAITAISMPAGWGWVPSRWVQVACVRAVYHLRQHPEDQAMGSWHTQAAAERWASCLPRTADVGGEHGHRLLGDVEAPHLDWPLGALHVPVGTSAARLGGWWVHMIWAGCM